jgi:hypothetical protein
VKTLRATAALVAIGACGGDGGHPPKAHPAARPPDAAIATSTTIDAAPVAAIVSPPDASTRTSMQLALLFPDHRPEIPPALGIRFGEPIEEARRGLPSSYGRPRFDVLDSDGVVKQVCVAELAATTDDLRAAWGNETTYLDRWLDPERGVRAIANESEGGITICIERYQPIALLLARLPLRPGIRARELAATLGGEQRAYPPEVQLPPTEIDETIGSTDIFVHRHGYSVTFDGGHDDVHAALVARWGQPHIDELRGPEIFATSPRVTAAWTDGPGLGGYWTLTIGTDDATH